MSRDVNDPISWHLWYDIISGDLTFYYSEQNCDSVKFRLIILIKKSEVYSWPIE